MPSHAADSSALITIDRLVFLFRFRILWTSWPSPLPAKSQHREFYSLPAPGGAWRFYNDWPGPTLPSYLGFESSWLSAQDQWNVFNVVPYWFLIFACSVAVVLPWLNKLFRQFSLRALLIATTLVAVGLGLIVYESGR